MLSYKTFEGKPLILSTIKNSSCAALIKSANKNPNELNIVLWQPIEIIYPIK